MARCRAVRRLVGPAHEGLRQRLEYLLDGAIPALLDRLTVDRHHLRTGRPRPPDARTSYDDGAIRAVFSRTIVKRIAGSRAKSETPIDEFCQTARSRQQTHEGHDRRLSHATRCDTAPIHQHLPPQKPKKRP